jgi:type II secretory pathway component PulF
MPVFEYIARDTSGREFSGRYADVDDISELRHELSRMNFHLIRACKEKNAPLKPGQNIRSSEIIAFAYEFSGMYSAGLTIVRCLETYEQQLDNPVFRAVIRNIREKVETGSSLKEAFQQHQEIFSEFFVAMVEAGEAGGKLSETEEN